MKDLIEFLDKYNTTYKIEDGSVVSDGLYLSGNSITELPESIGDINCDYIDLSNNKISKLPDSIGNLECYNLYLNNNKITKLPKSIGDIKCYYLYLSNNNIPRKGIKYLDKIEELEIVYTDYSQDIEEVKTLCIINSRIDKINSIL